MMNNKKCVYCENDITNLQLFCQNCGKILLLNHDTNYFDLLGLPHSFTIDATSLENSLLTKLQLLHPDQFVNKTKNEQENASQNSALVNAAHQTLASPIRRAEYLLSQNNQSTNEVSDQQSHKHLLMQAMEWHDALENASTISECHKLQQEILDLERKSYLELEEKFNRMAYSEAKQTYIELKFIARFKQQLEHKIDLLEE